ncbi:8816_t:CDS:2, partial [Rhizophagus irregularis]
LVEINISTTSITPSYDSNFSNNSSVISSDNSPIIPYDACTPYINMTLKEYPYLSLLYYNDECNDGYEFKSSGLCLGCENEYSKGKNFFTAIEEKKEGHQDCKLPSDIKEKFLFMVKTRGESRTFQLEAAEQICDRTVVKFFICCGVSFRLIEHPFFIDMVKSLYLEYDPSSANTLSQDFLYEELANIVVDQHLELKRTKNLMLGFDG